MGKKKILITGKNSYIGTSFMKWLSQWPDRYEVEAISVRGEEWRNHDFSKYDSVLHVAGIAHVKETKKNAQLYYQINRDLAFKISQKAKIEGVKQFIFISSMSVYGLDSGVIKKNTPLRPNSTYGKSKLQAEKLIKDLEDKSFKVAIIRPPMVYGKGCKGNYQKLSKFAKITPIFPDINNKRSMIFIDNLSEFIKKIIDSELRGLFLPQNKEYVKTSNMVTLIAKNHKRKIWLTKLFNPIIFILFKKTKVYNKVFGNLIYEKELSHLTITNSISFIDSIKLTEE